MELSTIILGFHGGVNPDNLYHNPDINIDHCVTVAVYAARVTDNVHHIHIHLTEQFLTLSLYFTWIYYGTSRIILMENC